MARVTAPPTSKDEDDQEAAEEFRADLNDYVGKYGCRADCGVDIGEVDLSHMRVEKTGDYDVSLTSEGPTMMQGFGDGSGPAKKAEKSLLSQLVDKLNERFGTEFTEQDVIRPFEEVKADPKVRARPSSTTRTSSGSSSTTSSRARWRTTSTPSQAWAFSTSAPTRASSPAWIAAQARPRGG